MARMEWTPDLAIGVALIDAQHRELFDSVNRLLDAIEQGRGREEVASLMLFLEDYTANHFGSEEAYMRRFHYPGYPAHKAEHTGFINDFIDLREDLDANGPSADLVAKISRRVCEWLLLHIGRVDKAFAAFLASLRRP